jgi:heat shock protein HspQ
LRWCHETETNIPLSQFIPPVHVEPPQVHPESLRLVARNDPQSSLAGRHGCSDNATSKTYFPPVAIVKETEMTIPVANSDDIKQLVRAIFRMNSYPPQNGITHVDVVDSKTKKEQISLAFEGIRNLNELTNRTLRVLRENRDNHKNRDGVQYLVGQVVKHTTQKWRGVVLGWSRSQQQQDDEIKNDDRDETDEQDRITSKVVTSLTKKSYESTNPEDDIKYMVILDWGDAALRHQARHPLSGIMEVYQSELTLVDDPDLLRIRSGLLGEHFKRFDPETRSFVPGDVPSYVYPNDTLEEIWSTYQNPYDLAAKSVIDGIQEMANYLRSVVLGYSSAPESRKLTILSSYLDKLTRLSEGDVIPTEELFQNTSMNGVSIQTNMKFHVQRCEFQISCVFYLRTFVLSPRCPSFTYTHFAFVAFVPCLLHDEDTDLAIEINDILWSRRTSKNADRMTKFSLGEVVKHKKYGFRGVVVSWDPGKEL